MTVNSFAHVFLIFDIPCSHYAMTTTYQSFAIRMIDPLADWFCQRAWLKFKNFTVPLGTQAVDYNTRVLIIADAIKIVVWAWWSFLAITSAPMRRTKKMSDWLRIRYHPFFHTDQLWSSFSQASEVRRAKCILLCRSRFDYASKSILREHRWWIPAFPAHDFYRSDASKIWHPCDVIKGLAGLFHSSSMEL